MWLVLVAAGVGFLFFNNEVSVKSLGELKDVEPINQGGRYKTDYDIFFKAVSNKTGVPFALLKAHAIAESSLNASAFRDESGGRPDRVGWASRGLMQILWSPLNPTKGDQGINNQRWLKYGYGASDLGVDGIRQFEPEVNITIAAMLIRENLIACKFNLRDAINMYNTGKKESVFPAPGGYVNKVMTYYETILGSRNV